jgi:uncharacterized RmlC-like cupin family protein
MSSSTAIHPVSPAEFDPGTAQTPGSERRDHAAALGIAWAVWGGLFEVEPGSRTGVHHHGEQETIAYVLSGICEIRWDDDGEFVACAKAGRFHSCAGLPAAHGNQPLESGAVSVGCGAQHGETHRHRPSGTPCRKPDVCLQTAFTDFANMEQSWTSRNPIQSSTQLRLPAAR